MASHVFAIKTLLKMSYDQVDLLEMPRSVVLKKWSECTSHVNESNEAYSCVVLTQHFLLRIENKQQDEKYDLLINMTGADPTRIHDAIYVDECLTHHIMVCAPSDLDATLLLANFFEVSVNEVNDIS